MSERIVSLDGKMMTKKALLGMKVEESEGCSRARRKGIVSRSLLLAWQSETLARAHLL